MVILFEGKGPAGFMPTGQVMVLGYRHSGAKSRESALGKANDNLALMQRHHLGSTTLQARKGRARNRS
jgi:hypothetical protein